MNYLSAEDISKNFGERWLFKDLSFGIAQGEKMTLVGINGSGKSTLLKILAGAMPPDTGSVSYRAGVKVAFLDQNPDFIEDGDVRQNIFAGENEALQAVAIYETLIEDPKETEAYQDKLQAAMSRMDELNAWDQEQKVQQILSKLGIHDLARTMNTLSGGQRKRVALARVLLEEPDLLIMDEPTNHLDLDTIEWLEEHISSKAQTLLLVSHDRYFLDRVTNEIVELDQGKIFRYKGDYANFLEKKAEREQIEATEVDKARNLMRKELDWMRRQPKARGTKAKYRVDAFAGLEAKAKGAKTQEELELSMGGRRQGKKVLEIAHLSKSFGDLKVVDDFSYIFRRGERVGIVGPNGVGKSSFVKLITGQMKPDSGEIDAGETTMFGHYAQETLELPEDKRIIEVVKEIAEVVTMADGSEISVSTLLTRFQFPPDTQYKYIHTLSGGERRRIQLLKVLVMNPNFLILDEPTNDLDILTLNILEEFLAEVSGCLMLISHDRYFMDRLVDHLFLFEGDGQIRDFPGNYTDYRDSRKAAGKTKQGPSVEVKQQKAAPAPPPPKEEKKKLSFKERQEYESIEAEIAKLENKKALLVEKLGSGDAGHEDLTIWAAQIEELTELIDEKTMRWMELEERE